MPRKIGISNDNKPNDLAQIIEADVRTIMNVKNVTHIGPTTILYLEHGAVLSYVITHDNIIFKHIPSHKETIIPITNYTHFKDHYETILSP